MVFFDIGKFVLGTIIDQVKEFLVNIIIGIATFLFWIAIIITVILLVIKFVFKKDITFSDISRTIVKWFKTVVIIIIVLIYFISPDILPGPIDDAIVGFLGFKIDKFLNERLE